jgi:sugar O-acyltransferase (sialic acid O-acetyltransferase NeuD family)
MLRAIFGAGGCGRGIMPLARGQFPELGGQTLVFVDDAAAGSVVNGQAVLSFAEFVAHPDTDKAIAIAVADPATRHRLAEQCSAHAIGFFEVRAANVVEMDDVEIGAGALLSPGVILTSNIRIGQHFHGNLGSFIEHDARIGDYVTFAPGVRCNGHVHIGDGAYVGAGAVIGMGAVVLEDVPAGTTVVGNPARVVMRAA